MLLSSGLTAAYAVVIETDAYAGNFHREVLGYCTGIFVEGDHGDKEAAEYFRARNLNESEEDTLMAGLIRFANYLGSNELPVSICNRDFSDKSDEHGPSSVVIYFLTKPSDDTVTLIAQRAREFAQQPHGLTIGSFNVVGVKIVRLKVEVEQLGSY